jgi:hypothetical protein
MLGLNYYMLLLIKVCTRLVCALVTSPQAWSNVVLRIWTDFFVQHEHGQQEPKYDPTRNNMRQASTA